MMFPITTYSHAHMIAQVRVKQLATRDSQNILKQRIVTLWQENKNSSGEEFTKNLQMRLHHMYIHSVHINDLLENFPTDQIGYPIKNNKTPLQLKMAYEWSQEKGEDLLGHLEENKLYHDLSNTIDMHLPPLQAPNKTIFWGNENPCVSSTLLAAIASIMGLQQKNMAGAALRYPFLDKKFTVKDTPSSYPFADEKSMLLFGNYQFGGQRELKEKSVLGPSDCSEAVANSTHLNQEQRSNFSTQKIRASFFNKNNEYNYIPITSTYQQSLNIDLIKSGDIFLHKGHVAIITHIDTKGHIETIEFNRDIDRAAGKISGGGTYSYNLIEKSRYLDSGPFNQIYILRDNRPPLKESYAYSDIVHKVDNAYSKQFGNKPKDRPGDCSMFINKDFWGNDSTLSSSSCCHSLC